MTATESHPIFFGSSPKTTDWTWRKTQTVQTELPKVRRAKRSWAYYNAFAS